MKNLIIILAGIFMLTSCREYYQIKRVGQVGTEIAAGKVTSYSTNYTFVRDSIVANDPLLAIEKFMEFEGWNISREVQDQRGFEYVVSPVNQRASSKRQTGHATFTDMPDKNQITLSLRLRGNYQFGTKKTSVALYNELKEFLYGTATEDDQK